MSKMIVMTTDTNGKVAFPDRTSDNVHINRVDRPFVEHFRAYPGAPVVTTRFAGDYCDVYFKPYLRHLN